MLTLDQIKAQQLAARKAGNEVEKNLLTTLIGEIEANLKRQQNQDVAAVTMSTVQAFLKGAREMRTRLNDASMDTLTTDQEIQILEAFLPRQLNRDEMIEILRPLAQLHAGAGPKFKGIAMKALKEGYPNQYDGKEAASVIDELIAG